MDNRRHNYSDPWDEGVYGTGKTQPPKSHGGIIALLSIIIIFLSGLVTFLSILNIRLFRQLNTQTETPAPLSFFDQRDVQGSAGAQNPSQDEGLMLNRDPELYQNPETQTIMPWKAVYEENLKSLVSVSCRTYDGTVEGTGIILTDDGAIVTNCHLVEDAEAITVSLWNGQHYRAVLCGRDPLTDLAVLRIDAENLRAAGFGDSASLNAGDRVAAVEYGAKSARIGTVSDPGAETAVGSAAIGLITTDIPSTCGSPLFNRYGQIVGIFTDHFPELPEGTVIPSPTVREILNQLLTQGYVSGRPGLGFRGKFLSRFEQRYYGIPQGMYITQVEPGSEAASAGIVQGDVLLRINGTAVTDGSVLKRLLYSQTVGSSISLVIYRDGQELPLTLTVSEDRG